MQSAKRMYDQNVCTKVYDQPIDFVPGYLRKVKIENNSVTKGNIEHHIVGLEIFS